jgi:hypothetical protein
MQEHMAMLVSWTPIRNSVQQQDFPEMLIAGYFHLFSSRVAASVVGIDNDREGQLDLFYGSKKFSRILNRNAYSYTVNY